MSPLEFKGKSGTNRVAGYKFKQTNPEAQPYEPGERMQGVELPPKVDLRPWMTSVENQGELNSCTANAIAGAYEYLVKRHLQIDSDLSRLFVYYNARWRTNDHDKDDGSVIQYGIESLQTFGGCPEPTWPYNPKAVNKKPKAPAYAEAAKFKVLDAKHLSINLDAWKTCLAEGYPIVFGCVLFDSFDECTKRGGVVPMPDPGTVGRGEHGLHAMLCVGYSDIDEVFIVRNSWGTDWGIDGYCYMPYNYLMSAKLNMDDSWIIRALDDLPYPTDTWVMDNKPVVKKKGIVANEYPADAYDRIRIVWIEQDEDTEYSDDVPEEYFEFADTIDYVYLPVEEDDSYITSEDEEEYDEDDEEEYEDEDDGEEGDDETDEDEEDVDEEDVDEEDDVDEDEEDEDDEEEEEEEDDDDDEYDEEEDDEEEDDDDDDEYDEEEYDEGDSEDGEEDYEDEEEKE
jgi:C1A family cysteine protease